MRLGTGARRFIHLGPVKQLGVALLDALLDSWDRSNLILLNLLRALPDDAMAARALDSSPTVAQLFMHINFVRPSCADAPAPDLA